MVFILFQFFIALIIPIGINISKNKNVQKNKYYSSGMIFSLFLVIFLKALEYDTGADYLEYYQTYKYYAGDSTYYHQYSEPGFILFNQILASISRYPQLFFGVAAFINYFSIIKFCENKRNAINYIIFLWPIFMLAMSLNIYRQYFSMSILLISIYYLEIKRYIYSITFFIISAIFHISSILLCPFIIIIYLLRNVKISKWVLISTVILVTICNTAFPQYFFLFNTFVNSVTDKSYGKEILDAMYGQSAALYYYLVCSIIVIFIGNNYANRHNNHRFYYYLMSFACILWPITNQEILMRLQLYFQIFMPIYLGLMISDKHLKGRLFLVLPIIFYIAMYIKSLIEFSSDFPLQFKLG